MFVPNAPRINIGPLLLQKASSFSQSDFEQFPEIYRSVAVFAPTGYPLISPITMAREQLPFKLKSGLITGVNTFAKNAAPPKFTIILLHTKKGNKDGTNDDEHNLSASFAAAMESEGNKSKNRV